MFNATNVIILRKKVKLVEKVGKVYFELNMNLEVNGKTVFFLPCLTWQACNWFHCIRTVPV